MDRMPCARPSLLAAAGSILAVLLLAACGSQTAGTGGSTPATTATAPATSLPATSPPPTSGTGAPSAPSGPTTEPQPGVTTTVTGTVFVTNDVGHCVTMRIAGRTHVLTGRGVAALHSGERVTVTGSIRTDMASYCQLGPIFGVTRIQRAT